jgi:hypothetical protein
MDPKSTSGYGVSKIGNQNNLGGSMTSGSNLYISCPQIVFAVDTHVKKYLDC